MKDINNAHGIISEHFQGVGTVTRDMVVKRAKEIAIINGRERHHYTKDDFMEAKRELTGNSSAEGEEDELLASLTSWDEEPGASGHSAHCGDLPDEQTIAEHLVEEGVSEAEHEQMVEAAKNAKLK